jgi:adenosylcobinamide-GDP ribazoletransferase
LIMKDSRIGTFGSLALLLVLMLRVAALSSLAPRCAVLALVAGHGLARAACVVMMAATPYAGDPDIAKWHPRLARVSPGTVILSLALAAWLLLLMPAPSAACGLLAAALPALFVARSAVRLIGGHTGDILGAIEQMAETGFLLGVAAAKCG